MPQSQTNPWHHEEQTGHVYERNNTIKVQQPGLRE